MISIERPFEVLEEVQRQGQDLADRLAQGFTGLIQCHMKPNSFPWPNPPKSMFFDLEFSTQNFGKMEFRIANASSGIDGVSAILDIGGRIGQAGAELGVCLNGVVQQFFRRFPVPFLAEDTAKVAIQRGIGFGDSQICDVSFAVKEGLGTFLEGLKDFGFNGDEGGLEEWEDEEVSGVDLSSVGQFGRPQGSVNVTSTYDSRSNDVKSSLAARGDLWRIEASHDRSASGNNNSSLFLVQLGPLLLVRDSTLLLPVHLSKQHLLWYGYDKKNRMHSLCPAVWSKHRSWLLMSMLCLNPVTCSFLDLQFPNGQVSYLAGEGMNASAFLPLCGGLLQVQGQYPGEMRFSFSYKNKMGTQITPMLQWPGRSFTLGLAQEMAWHKSGLLVRPTIQVSASTTFGGSNPGLQAEVIHSIRDHLSLMCGCSLTAHPSCFASISFGRSKWNRSSGNSGITVRVDTPLPAVGRPSFSVQLNSGVEF